MARRKKYKGIACEVLPSGIAVMHINPNATPRRNEMHFGVQVSTRAHVFRDRTKYTRKIKHRNRED